MTEAEFAEALLTKLRNIPRFHWEDGDLENKGPNSGGNIVIYKDVSEILVWADRFRPRLRCDEVPNEC
jgi:hypothetical protein